MGEFFETLTYAIFLVAGVVGYYKAFVENNQLAKVMSIYATGGAAILVLKMLGYS